MLDGMVWYGMVTARGRGFLGPFLLALFLYIAGMIWYDRGL